jgi:hypothetical protein
MFLFSINSLVCLFSMNMNGWEGMIFIGLNAAQVPALFPLLSSAHFCCPQIIIIFIRESLQFLAQKLPALLIHQRIFHN